MSNSFSPKLSRKTTRMEYGSDVFKECMVESFGNSVLLWGVVNGSAMGYSLEA